MLIYTFMELLAGISLAAIEQWGKYTNSGNDRADRSWGRNDDRFFSSVVCNDRILYVYGI